LEEISRASWEKLSHESTLTIPDKNLDLSLNFNGSFNGILGFLQRKLERVLLGFWD